MRCTPTLTPELGDIVKVRLRIPVSHGVNIVRFKGPEPTEAMLDL